MLKTNTKAKISANKLGEYIDSLPNRRRTIIRDQKYPKGYIVSRYSGAKKSIIDFFVKGKGDRKKIQSEIESLILKSYNNSKFKKQDNELSIKALEIFAKSNIPSVEAHETSKFESNLNKLQIEGVEVSVHPDILIKGSIRGKDFIGAIKVHISKGNPLNQSSGKYVAALIHNFLEKNNKTKVKPDFCISLDIFTGQYFTATRSFKSLRKDIEAACAEIRLLWNDL
jgi:hypothetical protein